MKTYFPVVRLSRDDIKHKDAYKLTDEQMERIASKMGDMIMEDYWLALEEAQKDYLNLCWQLCQQKGINI